MKRPGPGLHTEMCRTGSLHIGRIGCHGSCDAWYKRSCEAALTVFTASGVEAQLASRPVAASKTKDFISGTFRVALELAAF